jgi:hypothetical protein
MIQPPLLTFNYARDTLSTTPRPAPTKLDFDEGLKVSPLGTAIASLSSDREASTP